MIQKALLYCTKGKLSLRKSIKDKDYYLDNGSEFNIIPKKDYVLNGKIVAECDFEVVIEDTSYNCIDFRLSSSLDGISRLDKSCLTTEQLFDYVKGKNAFYSIHIKNLHIFDEPRELSYYYRYCPYSYNPLQPIKVAPQNMMYAYNFKDYDEKPEYILISIKPEWLCKILNNEKTIEVRKKVLREMIK